MWKEIRKSPGALIGAILVHVGLVALLVLSLEWKTQPPPLQGAQEIVQAVVIDESKLRAEEESKRQEALRQQKEEAARRQREAEEKRHAEEQRQQQRLAEAEAKRKMQEQQRLETEAEAARKAKAEAQRKAEVAAKLKAEAEAQRKVEAEAQRKAEAEATRKAELEAKRKAAAEAEAKRKAEQEVKRKAEAKRKAAEAAKRKAEAEAKRKAEEEARRRKEAEESLKQGLLAEQQERAASSEISKYVEIIKQKIGRNWIKPPSVRSDMLCTVRVRLIPGGEVVDARVVKSSGDPLFDRSVETAVFKASPLPLPPDASLFDRFRDLEFVFKPEG